MNGIDFELILYILGLVLGGGLAPAGAHWMIARKRKLAASECADDILALMPEEIERVENVKQMIGIQRYFHWKPSIPFLLLGVGGAVLSLLNLPFPDGFLEYYPLAFSVAGPAYIGIRMYTHIPTRHPRFMEELIERVLRKGRYAQVDAFLGTIYSLTWHRSGISREEAMLFWGSWKASALLDTSIRGNRLKILLEDPSLRRTWFENSENLRMGIRNAASMEIDVLLELAEKHFFWAHLLSHFNEEGILEQLVEMDDTASKLKLVNKLQQQRNYLEAHPEVFCPRCRSRGTIVETKYAQFVHCDCQDSSGMVTGINRVVGMIGNVHLPGVKEGVFYLSVWDEEENKVINGEIDQLVVDADFSGNLDWALTAFLENQGNRYPERDAPYPLSLPESLELKPNTLKILAEKVERLEDQPS